MSRSPYQAGSSVYVLVPCVLSLVTSYERNDLLFVLWRGSTILPFGLCDTPLTATRHDSDSFVGLE